MHIVVNHSQNSVASIVFECMCMCMCVCLCVCHAAYVRAYVFLSSVQNREQRTDDAFNRFVQYETLVTYLYYDVSHTCTYTPCTPPTSSFSELFDVV